MGRDKEAGHDWAVKQTGVDPVTLAAQPPPSPKSGGGGALGGAAVGAGAAPCRATREPGQCRVLASGGSCTPSARADR